ncbi:hypothetical protein AB0I22_05990 [Streptomyces sp. NPDC050610]|uniref:hypothetical protein n=1 Tax=Streptomyces sp. NPDC050610 TaxID=3157097 RepID=UPI00342FCFF0
MKLRQVASDWDDGPCPTVRTVEGAEHILVQDFKVEDAETLATMELPDNETAVSIPHSASEEGRP